MVGSYHFHTKSFKFIIILFNCLRHIKQLFLSFMGSNLINYTQFQLIRIISYRNSVSSVAAAASQNI